MHTKVVIWFVCCWLVVSDAFAQQERVAAIDGPYYDWAGSVSLYRDSLLVLAGATWPYYNSYGRGLLNVVDKNLQLRYQLVCDGLAGPTSFKSVVVSGDTVVCFGSKQLDATKGGVEGAVFKFHGNADPVCEHVRRFALRVVLSRLSHR